MVLAGVAKTDITPPVGIELTGYIGRQQPSVGIHDPLFAKAIVLADGNTKLALVSCDLLALSRESVAAIRQAVNHQSQIPLQNILIACTHTHSGPATVFLRNCGTVDKDWLAKLEQQISNTIIAAANSMEPVNLGFGIGTADINLDRRTKKDTTLKPNIVDKSLGVIKLDLITGEPLAIIINYTCHPVVLAEKNRYISADYPGAVCDYISSRYPNEPLVVFFNGACGNINPVIRGGTWDDVYRLGEIIGKRAIEVLDSISTNDAMAFSAISQDAELELKIPTIAGLEYELDIFREKAALIPQAESMNQRVNSAMVSWAEETLNLLKRGKVSQTVPLEIQVIKLGELILVGIGAEVFCEIGLNIKKEAGAPTLIIGYANHVVGYIPTRKAFDEGGYEVDTAYRYYGNFMLTRDAQHTVETTTLHLIKSI
ncbi:MAG: neutral/alkaline non-lysosomal ceramidase N-terminal domain-containing protein [bacterium]|nr:neutral/alkaline non-lysosomal ceramidase N-terminal domain-containing protein [bacterium]